MTIEKPSPEVINAIQSAAAWYEASKITGKRLEYDPATGRITNMSEANDWLKRTYRSGWTLNG